MTRSRNPRASKLNRPTAARMAIIPDEGQAGERQHKQEFIHGTDP